MKLYLILQCNLKLNIMKLELKHLAPYLPYGLKGIDYDKKTYLFKGLDDNGNIYWDCNEVLDKKGYDVKPILRPLSDLIYRINPIQHHTYLDGLNHNSIEKIQDLIMKGILYLEDYNYLIEYHFDVFGLIEQGLAIDINTLNDETTNNLL